MNCSLIIIFFLSVRFDLKEEQSWTQCSWPEHFTANLEPLPEVHQVNFAVVYPCQCFPSLFFLLLHKHTYFFSPSVYLSTDDFWVTSSCDKYERSLWFKHIAALSIISELIYKLVISVKSIWKESRLSVQVAWTSHLCLNLEENGF